MQEKSVHVKYMQYNAYNELLEADRELLAVAREVAAGAYAPYSLFRVGAAVLLSNGVIVRGSNQENVAFPSGLCAEQVALCYAGAEYLDMSARSVAISALNSNGEMPDIPVTPCGSCRQVMVEYEKRWKEPLRVIMEGRSYIIVVHGVSNLLPLAFNIV